MNNSTPLLKVDGHLATITLCRPKVANRLAPEDLAALCVHIQTINANDQVLVTVIQGTGKYFCSGYDISEVAKTSQIQGRSFGEMVDAVENCRTVTVAAINGGVYGGATDLALACDFRIGALSTEMFMPAARLGLHFYYSGLVRYVTRLGPDVARRLFLTCEKLDAQAMFACGFLTQEPVSDLDAKVAQLCETLAAMAPIPLLGMKRFINEIAHHRVDKSAIDEQVRRTIASKDIAEGAAAWAEESPCSRKLNHH